ncbi:MAG: 3-oxoacyl-[acyl-carrier-protein] synthase III C-terminal domain-containing protein [Haloarculaceae archaeon]
MATVTRRGLYLPRYRIGTGAIREQWGGGADGVKSKAVQAKDDDPTTLSVRAGQSVLDGRRDVDALFFASTTPVYEYGSVTPFLAEALDLPEDTYVQSFAETARAGTAALRAAADAVAGDSDAVLVVAAETPSPEPRTDREKTAGAGAAAALVEADGDGLDQAATAARARPVLDEWRAPGGEPLQSADDRFGRDVGYVETARRAIEDALDTAGWAADDVDALVVTQPNGKFASRLAGAVGVGDALATPSFGREYGDLRAASALGSLALSDLSAGDRVVVAGYGAGTADAVAYEATAVPEPADEPGEGTALDYVQYLEHVDQL